MKIQLYERNLMVHGAPAGPTAPDNAGAGFRAVADAGGAAVALGRHINEVRSQSWVYRSEAGLGERSTRAFLDAQRGATGDGAGFADRVLAGFDADVSALVNAAPSNDAARTLQDRATAMRTRLHARAYEFELAQGARSAAGGVTDTLNSAAATIRADPSQLEAATAAFVGSVRATQLPEARQNELIRGGRDDLVSAWAHGTAERDPAAARRRIVSGDLAGGIDEQTRQRLLNNIDVVAHRRATEANMARERAERRAERELRRIERETGDELYGRHARGELTFEDVERNRRNLSSGDYRALLRATRGGTDFDQPDALVALTERLDALAPDAFQREAARALQDGTIRPDTYRTLVERNRSARRDDQPASPYRNGREFIREGLDPGILGSGPQEMALRVARSRALAEFDQWIAANPGADGEAATRQAEGIVRRYQAFQGAGMRLSLPLPYGHAGARSQVDGAAIEAARGRLAEALGAGTIGRGQAAREWEYLDQWEATINRAGAPPRPQAAPAVSAPAASPARPAPALAPIPDERSARAQREAAIEWLRANDPAVYQRLATMSVGALQQALADAIARMREETNR